jgi:hypothetical protein
VSVGEVSKVMTQVDHDLTPVNEFDRQFRANKKLGASHDYSDIVFI